MPALAEPTDPPKVTVPRIVAELQDTEMPLVELAAVMDAKVIGQAWAAGLIEFGRPAYSTMGATVDGKPAPEGSTLLIEGGMEWSGPKTGQHKPFAHMAFGLPVCERYERADVPMVRKVDPRSGNETYHRPAVSRAEAERLVGYLVRLTDKGLSLMAAE